MSENVKPAKKKKGSKKKEESEVVGGIRLASNVGPKKAMELMSERIQVQGRKPPKLDLTAKDPAAKFMIAMYAEIAQWSEKNLYEFIEEVTGEQTKDIDLPALMSQVKKIFHAMFMDEGEDKEKVLAFDSRWKMWPHVKRKGKEEEETEEMADNKQATKKKTQSKKAAKKKAAKKVAKKTSTKKTSTKKTSAKKAPAKKDISITEKTKIKAVRDSGVPKMANRKLVKESVPSGGIQAGNLCEKAGCTLKTVEAMITKGFLEIA